MAEKKLFLLDGHALVYRAHYAFITRPLINSKGINTSAITGFLRSLWDILQNQRPTHIAVAFDPHGPVFRNEMFPAYKANRDEQPEDIGIALPYIRRIVEGFNIPIIELENYEADDAIGTVAKQAELQGFTVYMVTPDKDYAQLVTDNVKMYKPSRQGNGVDILGPEDVLREWGLRRIDQVADFLGLQGDSVDNIPGIPGIGPKTAQQLLEKYDTVEGVIAHVDELKGKQQENVRLYADQARLSKELATIHTNVPITFDEKRFEIEPIDKEALSAVFRELEFKTLARTILGEEDAAPGAQGVQQSLFADQPSTTAALPQTKSQLPAIPSHSTAEKTIHTTTHTYHLVNDEVALTALLDTLGKAPQFCMDTETTDLDANLCELVGMSFSIQPGEAYYVPVPADQDEARALLERFRPVLEDPEKEIIGQNIKFDALVLRWYGIELSGRYFDTMVAHYLLEPELRHGMDYLAETYLQYQTVPIEALIGKKGKEQGSMRDVPLEEIKDYAAEDADITLQLYQVLAPRLGEARLEDLYRKVEGPLIHVLTDMEYAGIRVDKDYLGRYSGELGVQISALEKKIYELAGTRFNIGSPKQVGELLFEIIGIPYRWKKTKSGQYATDEDKLVELAPQHPVVEEILQHRTLTKLKSTYVDALPGMINPKSGRIHSSFNQALAATGRLSSNNPNLQNIPIRTAEGRRVREAFTPRDADHVLVAADYSQIELRLIAEISEEQAMLDAFQAGHDIHAATAAKVYGVPLEQVTAAQRRNAKTVNFSIIYGAGAQNLSRQLNIKRTEAKELIDQYFAQYQGLKAYMERTVEFARENKYVETLLGRRRWLRDIDSRNALARSGAERVAINSPIQGSAADMIKIAMIDIHAAIRKEKLKSKLVLQVHDELVFDAPREELDILQPLVREKMKNAIPSLKVPILVEIGIGNTWLEAH